MPVSAGGLNVVVLLKDCSVAPLVRGVRHL